MNLETLGLVGWAVVFAIVGALAGVALVLIAAAFVPRLIDRLTPNIDEGREIVLVNNRDDRRQDEFTARITAHAQLILSRAGQEVRHDEWVKPWTEFWTFGRDAAGTGWALRAIQPAANGDSIVARENTDEGSSVEMLQWYYSKTRAS